MWPIVFAVLRRNAVYITLPFAFCAGLIGYNLENLFSDKYTPYSKSVQESRAERLTDEAALAAASTGERAPASAGVLERNLPPSLQKK